MYLMMFLTLTDVTDNLRENTYLKDLNLNMTDKHTCKNSDEQNL